MFVTKKIKSMSTSKGVTPEEIEAMAEKFADDNYEHIEKVHEYNTAGDLIKGFTAGYKAALEAYASTKEAVREEDGWIDVKDRLPEYLETVWISNGKGWTTLGCRSDLYDNGEGGLSWCWAATNGIIYEEDGKIISECEEDDLDVKFWQPLPSPPKQLK